MIAFDKGYSNFSDREDYPGVEIKSDDSGNTIIKELFSHWCQKYKDETKKVGVCSPHLLGKIITRIYYTVNTIANNNKSNTNLGVAMHRRVVALLNAILIEDIVITFYFFVFWNFIAFNSQCFQMLLLFEKVFVIENKRFKC